MDPDGRGGGKDLIGIHVGETIQDILCEKNMFFSLKRKKSMDICMCVCTTCVP